jgi:putative ABC transport system permease protein
MAWRSLLKNKVSSIINIVGLAVGLATTIIILLVVLDELSYDRFNTNLANIYVLLKNQKQMDGISTGSSTAGPMAAAFREQMPETRFATRIAYVDNQLIRTGDKTMYESGIYTEPDIFNMLSFTPLQGNPVAALREGSMVVITEQTAKKMFGNADAMGKSLVIDNRHFVKVGAVIRDIPSNSTVRFNMALPFGIFAGENEWLNKWDDNRIQTWVQLKPSANIPSLNARLTNLLQARSNDSSVSLFVYPLSRYRLYGNFSNGKPSGGRIYMVILISALGLFILGIACINFMNIATARSERRAREVGVRKVLGAARKWIVFQFLSEAILLSFLALAGGILLAAMALPDFNQFAGKNLHLNFLDWQMWLILVAIGLLTGLVAGSYPAFFLSRFKAVRVLKGMCSDGKSGAGLRKTLVTVQFIISIFFIIGTIVIYKQINYVRNRPLGYDQENLVDIAATGDLAGNFQEFKNAVSRIPGVSSVTAGSDNILQYGGGITGLDFPGKIPGQEITVSSTTVQYNWTKTMGIPIKEGRDFSPDFSSDTSACLINETTVQKMGLKEPVIGTKISGATVIGVFHNFVFNNPSGIIAPMIVYLQKNNLQHFFVRIRNNDNWRQTLAQMQQIAKKLNPEYPFDVSFTKEDYQQRFEEWGSYSFMATLFGCMAILISCLGLFGLSSFLAERRSREMSVRKVFGADVTSIWFLLSKDFLKPVLLALLIVIPVSVWLTGYFLSGVVYHTQLSWWMFALAALITVLIALATVSFQGIRTALENPVKKLRTE